MFYLCSALEIRELYQENNRDNQLTKTNLEDSLDNKLNKRQTFYGVERKPLTKPFSNYGICLF